MRVINSFLLICWGTLTAPAFAAPPDLAHDWPWWRGPNFNGVAAPQPAPPTEWSENQNVIWKTPVTGRGHASPTIVGNRIFLATADERSQIQGVECFDRETGKRLWITSVVRGNFPARIHNKNTHASGTVACDGEQVYCVFFNNRRIVVSALNVEDGETVWQKSAGGFNPGKYQFGYGSSPLLYKNYVITAAESDRGSFIVAMNKSDGSEAWRIRRRADISFSSPVVANVAGGEQLLISGLFEVSSYDPNNGNKLWSTAGTTQATCGTMVWDGDIVFASGGFPDPQTIAVKADGSGRVLWTKKEKCYEQSMLAHDGYLYAMNDNGIFFCWRAEDGAEMWKTRLSSPVSASPTLVNDVIYATDERGNTYVFKANPRQYEEIARNKLGSDSFPSPTIVDGKIYLRVGTGDGRNRKEYLYCIGNS